jgi:septal ring factor EnvC (AmiA/AmiB activator)
MKPKTKSKKPQKPSYRQLERTIKDLSATSRGLSDKLTDQQINNHSYRKRIEDLDRQIAEARQELTRQREVTGLYFAAISNPVTAKDAERIAGLQRQIFEAELGVRIKCGADTVSLESLGYKTTETDFGTIYSKNHF